MFINFSLQNMYSFILTYYNYYMIKILSQLLDLIYKKRCYFCGCSKENTKMCSKCFQKIKILPSKIIKNIDKIPVYSATVYEKEVQKLIRGIKYHRQKELAFFQLEAKFPFLLSDDRESYKRWTNWFPEANSYIMQNRNISFRSRFLQYMASQGQFWYVWLYYRLFIKFIYGVLYK